MMREAIEAIERNITLWLIVVYFLLGVANLILHRWWKAAYWLGAAILTLGVLKL